MPLLQSNIVLRPAMLNDGGVPAQNGGRMNPNSVIANGVKNNLFPDVGESERINGATAYRKAFFALTNTDLDGLSNARVLMDALTPAADSAVFYAGTMTDTVDQLVASGRRCYGAATLSQDIAADSVVLNVQFENTVVAGLQPIRAGDQIRITSRRVGETSGAEFFATVQGVVYTGADAEITVAAPLAPMAASGALVSSVYNAVEMRSTNTAPVLTSAAGVLNVTGPLVTSNRGVIAQAWTVTFTSASNFALAGDGLGAGVQTGNIYADFAPLNPNGQPYFRIPQAAWSGTFSAGDTVEFSTSPPAIPVFYRRDVPAGTGTLAGNSISLALQGEIA